MMMRRLMMKKIFKAIRNFFLSIWRFIDKKIILPITKLVLKITGRVGGQSSVFENA